MSNFNQNINSNDYIVIPNPIYDVVFKYLMEDTESAKIVISTLINEKIKTLTFEPVSHTESIKDPGSEKDIKLFHLDFTAIIEKPDGEEELIMIEIQKANHASDIFRFKRYISANFQKKQEKEIINPVSQIVEKINKPIRLIPIFILNFRIENEINDLLIKTNRIKTGIFKEKTLEKINDFIDNLSFDIYVVQLPNISNIKKQDYEGNEYKTKLYSLLKLFDQQAQNPENKHRLLLVKRIFPGFLERVINRLKAADAENPELEDQMNAEDEYLAELIRRDNTISFIKQELEKTSEQLEKTSEELEKTSEELEKTSEELEKTSEELEKTALKLEQERKLKEEQQKIIYDLAKTLKENGVPVEVIMQKTKLSKDEIEKI
ncbi:MAG: hypothetical protein L3J74_15855 [Bacteroidales bacterium]|nr:hypothetical protein [Bacteroidales bacterium]